MQELTLVLGIAAASLHGVAYFLYNVQTKRGLSSPNVASWSIWAFLASLNALSYREMNGDLAVALQFFTGSAASILTFLYALIIGRFHWPKVMEWMLFGLALVATLVWWVFRSAVSANMIVLLAVVISFIPTYLGVLRDPFKETPLAWTLWTVACLVTIVNVSLHSSSFVIYVMPVVLLILHGVIALLSTKKRKARFSAARA